MRIDPQAVSSLKTSPPGGEPASAQKPSGSPLPDAEASTHVSSPERQRLLHSVQQVPDVRADRVRQAAERVAGGYYNTPQAIEKTAAAILKSPE